MRISIKKILSLLLVVCMLTGIIQNFGMLSASAKYNNEYYYTSGQTFLSEFALAKKGGLSGGGSKDDLRNNGFTLIDKDLNDGAGGNYVYTGYKTTTSESDAIRGLAFYNGGNPPSTYTYNGSVFNIVTVNFHDSSSASTSPIDLNASAGGDYIYMYYTKDPNYGPPLTDFDWDENSSNDANNICKTPVTWLNTNSYGTAGKIADLNAKAGGDYIYFFVHSSVDTKVDTNSLRTAVSNGNSYIANSAKYINVSTLQTAVNTGNSIIADYDAEGLSCNYDQTAINNATSTINSAINALQTRVTLNANGGTIGTTQVDVTVGANTSFSFNTASYVPSRTGYTFKGWSTSASATSGTTGTMTLGLMPVLYAVWQANEYHVTFDNLIDFSAWNKSANDGSVSDVTDTGMTITSDSGVGEATSSSPFFAVEPGKSYKIDMDITGDGWDVYIFFCDANGNSVDFADGPTNRYSSNGSGADIYTRVFTAPVKDNVVKAQIRLDANGSSNTVRFDNIRVYEDNEVEVSPVNKYVTYDSSFGELPVPVRYGYDFDGWYDSNNNKIDSSSVAKHTSTLFLHSEWKLNNDSLNDDVVTVDFGLPVTFSPIENDNIFNDEIAASGFKYIFVGLSDSDTSYSSSVEGDFGTFILNGENVTYTPTGIMNSSDVINYRLSVNYDGKETFVNGKIIIMPANIVYYEDDFSSSSIEYTDGVSTDNSTGKWMTSGSSLTGSVSQSLSEDVYGFDPVYAEKTDNYSMGAAHYVSVSKYNNPKGTYNGVTDGAGFWPVAEFTFAGTGFDVVSLISNTTGAIEVKVFSGTETSSAPVYDWIVDTYYGYKIQDGEWIVDSDAENSIYQIPVISNNTLPYGIYTVQIIPTYTSRLDHQKAGSYEFYLDAIRVYNPMGDNSDAASVYAGAGEYTVTNQVLRDILINAKDLDASSESTGVVYINSGVTEGTYEQYKSVGPKNEVYLSRGQSVAFNMTVEGFIPDSVCVSAHAIDGAASMRFVSGDDYSDGIIIAHKTTLYYKIPFMNSENWKDNGDGTYTTKHPIVITNNGDGLLSLCNIRVTTDGIMAAPVMFSMNPTSFSVAADSADSVAGLTQADGALFVPDSMVSAADSDVVATGEDVLVTINTSSEVHTLTVNGVNATLVSENEDGSRTWSYTYTAESRGEQTFTLVAYNSDGFASEETTVTVDVQSKVEIFFNKVSQFFSMIVEFLDKLFSN